MGSVLGGFFKNVEGLTVFGGYAPPLGSDDLRGRTPYEAGAEITIGLNDDGWSSVLAVGYVWMSGFQAKEPSLEFRGAVQTLPAITVYLSPPVTVGGTLYPYVGVTTGLVGLVGAQGFDPTGARFEVDGTAFQVGASLGLVEETTGLFVEGGFRIREFASLDWERDGDDVTPPGQWPRSLTASVAFLRLGVQFWR